MTLNAPSEDTDMEDQGLAQVMYNYRRSIEASVAERVSSDAAHLIQAHWREIEDSWGDDPKVKISFGVTLRKHEGGVETVTQISFSKTVKDEVEGFVDNPNQEQINFEG